MKKFLIIIFVFIGLNNCKSQDVEGIWMLHYERPIDSSYAYSTNYSGFLIDFEKSEMGHIISDSILPITIDFKNRNFNVEPYNVTTEYKVYQKDSIEMQISENTISIFHILELNNPIVTNKKTIENFLSSDSLKNIETTLDISFSNKFYSSDILSDNTNKRKSLVNKTWEADGYWVVRELNGNYFLIFTIDQTTDPNIYQILSISECKIELKPILIPKDGGLKINKIETCL